MLILKNQIDQPKDWLIVLEMKNGDTRVLHGEPRSPYQLHQYNPPFRGTRFQMDCYTEHLVYEAKKQGLPLAAIHVDEWTLEEKPAV